MEQNNQLQSQQPPVQQVGLSPEQMQILQQQMMMQQMMMQQQQQSNANMRGTKIHDRNRLTAALLAFFLGGFGAHKFYLGETGMGVLYLLFFWTFIPAIGAFIEMIIYLTQTDEQFDRKYNYAP
jgi:TM2 domain-containing membrane protein YozV